MGGLHLLAVFKGEISRPLNLWHCYMWWFKFTNESNFQLLEVVNRDSETQLQVTGNELYIYFLLQSSKSWRVNMEIRLQRSVPTWGPYLPALFRHCTNIITVYVNVVPGLSQNLASTVPALLCTEYDIVSARRVTRTLYQHWSTLVTPQQTENICITFVQHRPNFFHVAPTLYRGYTNVLC